MRFLLLDTASLDTSSPQDGAVFFSGARAKRAAKKLAGSKNNDFKTVIDTDALKAFNTMQSHYFGRNASVSVEEAYFVGDCISENFAGNATGSIRVYLDGIKPHGTFARCEVPQLIQNTNITEFVIYDYDGVDLAAGQKVEPITLDCNEFKAYIECKLAGKCDRRLGNQAQASVTSGKPHMAPA
jgi:hypothetical protein